jgi:recombination protein RecA
MTRELTALEQSLMKNINKKFRDSYKDDAPEMVQLGENTDRGKISEYVDTSVYSLNWLISGKLQGGYPVGRITELDGDPSTGKSLLCEVAMKDPTIDLIIYLDTEMGMNIEFLQFLSVDPNKILYQPIDTVEQIQDACQEILDTVIMNNKSNKKILLVIDSIALASTTKEMDPSGGSDMGYKARMLRKFFRVYARKIERYNIALLVTNHYTQNIGVMYGPSKTTTGGTALPYAASVRLDLKVVDLELDKKLETLGASAVTIKATTVKNRCFSPKRKITFVLDFERGVNRYSGLFQILLHLGLAEKNGAWCSFPAWSTDEKFYAKDFASLVEENDLLPLIQSEMDKAVKKSTEEDDYKREQAVINELAESGVSTEETEATESEETEATESEETEATESEDIEHSRLKRKRRKKDE